jgi:tRNA-splicing ligase RtcB (3'-phosphate/5'-hydroxy nucleic acid ligase)
MTGDAITSTYNRAAPVSSPRSAQPRIFDSDNHPARLDSLALLNRGLTDAHDLAAAPAVLPDFYHKRLMEMPSSIAVATRDTIRPTFTSAALNCGMALVGLDIDIAPHETAIRNFYDAVRGSYPYPPNYKPVLTASEVVRCAVEGAGFAVDRYGLDPSELDRIEEGGCLGVEAYGGEPRIRRELSWMATELSRIRFGTVGPSTHFVELQRVEEVFDSEVAAKLGVRPGQITLQYHGGDGVLNIQMGARFGRRLAGSRALRMVMSVQKPLYQLASVRSARQARERLRLYFSGGCPPVPRHSEEGERLMLANAVSMNYGFAYRQATYATLRALARQSFGAGMRLIVDSPHNTIYDEEIDGAPAVVHRHNSARAFPASKMRGHPAFAETGMPLLLPGTNRTSSYLCVAAEGAHRSLFSASHGTGSIISDFEKRGLSERDPQGHTTLKFGYQDRSAKFVPHLDDRGVNEGLRILASNHLVRPVARLRPFAVLN